MTTTDIPAKVKRIIARQLVFDEELLTLDSTWEDLDADMTDRARVMNALEEEFGPEISLAESERIMTVGGLITTLEERET
jgi:acyl carrier protein